MINRTNLFVAALAAPMAFMAPPTLAQPADAWRFQGTLNLYLPDISGRMIFPAGAATEVAIDAETILENLKMTFMGSIQASKGSWGVFTDVLYMDVGDTQSQFHELGINGLPLPAGADATVAYDLKGWVWTLGGVWHLSSDPAASFDIVAGARLLDVEAKLDWTITGNVGSIPLPGRAGNATVGLANWDAIVGVKGRVAFGEDRKWFVPYYADIGAGESSFTWQAMGGIGYSFRWGDVVGAWRHVDYDMKSGSKVESLSFDGPSISAVFRW
jgi:hypothetical protein